MIDDLFWRWRTTDDVRVLWYVFPRYSWHYIAYIQLYKQEKVHIRREFVFVVENFLSFKLVNYFGTFWNLLISFIWARTIKGHQDFFLLKDTMENLIRNHYCLELTFIIQKIPYWNMMKTIFCYFFRYFLLVFLFILSFHH